MSSLADQRLHLWSRVLPPPETSPRGYGTCGVHIGRFTQDLDKVNCPNCLAIINAKKETGEPVEPVSQ